MRLQGKVAVVTGGGSGFGAAISTRFAEEGASVVIADRNGESAHSLAASLQASGYSATAVRADVTDAAEIDEMIDTAIRAFGKLSIVVNNAGIGQRLADFHRVSPEIVDRLFDVNVKSILYSSRAALEHLEAQRGCILNVSSVGASRPRPGAAWYNASKAALSNLTLTMAAELGCKGIRVNALLPVAADTPLLSDVLGGTSEDQLQHFISGIPLGRLATPADVASAALFLASDEACFLSGVLLPVDGGRAAA
jgi:3-oxoacyl-[acyl-carrier protein] reductase